MNYLVILFFTFYLLAHCASNNLLSLKKEWEEHKEKYDLEFDTNEETIRFNNFLANREYIEQRNSLNLGYELGMNHFGHWSYQEYLDYVNKGTIKQSESEDTINDFEEIPYTQIKSIDWRKKNAVTSVKNQGSCGSCWAFAATGLTEGMHSIKHKKLIGLSTQDMVDCSKGDKYGCDGCDGGFREGGLQYVVDNGLTAESAYNYTGKDGECKHNQSKIVARLAEVKFVEKDNETALSLLISNFGPITVGIDAGDQDFMFYKKGIYKSSKCNRTINHGILAVGLSTSKPSYYIIKNSWSTTWGEEGYVRFARNNNNQCHIAQKAVYAIPK